MDAFVLLNTFKPLLYFTFLSKQADQEEDQIKDSVATLRLPYFDWMPSVHVLKIAGPWPPSYTR